tara:strand:- start:1045 stop:1212 length:168 start_codon:yes stop_codon:yes gene_type:complete
MESLIKELWYKYKVRAIRLAIVKITETRRKLNEKQKQLSKSADKYAKLHKEVSKL